MYKLSIILTIAVVALGSALSLSVDYGIRKNADCLRLQSNQSTLLSQIETFRVRDSLNGASIRVLTLRGSEFESHFASLNALINDMGLRMKHIESVSENAIRSQYEISAPLKDSIVQRVESDGLLLPMSIQTINYNDPYLQLRGRITGGHFHGSIECHDTLTQIVHRIPRKFLFFRWGTKELKQQIVSSNPHTRITYSRHIKISK